MSPVTTLARLARRVRRRLLLHRRLLAALSAGLAVLIGLQAASPPPPASVPVWTTARELPAGTVVRGSDLVRTDFRPASVPPDAVRDARQAIGRTLAAPVGRGEPLTSLRLVSAGLLRGYPGRTAVPLRITDAEVVSLLRVGDEIGVVVADPEGRAAPRQLVESVPVVAVPRADRSVDAGTPGRLVVVAVPTEDAAQIAAEAATGILIPVWSD